MIRQQYRQTPIKKEIYNRTLQPLIDLYITLQEGIFGARATFPYRNTRLERDNISITYMAPCEITRASAREKLKQISEKTHSPIVKGLASFLNRN